MDYSYIDSETSVYDNTKRYHKMGKGTILLGVVFVLFSLFSLAGYLLNNFTQLSSPLQNIISIVFYAALGVVFIVIGGLRGKKVYYDEEELLTPHSLNKKVFGLFKYSSLCISILMGAHYIGQAVMVLITLIESLEVHSLPPYIYSYFLLLLNFCLLIIGMLFWSIYFLRFFGKRVSTLFSSGILLICMSFVISWFITILQYYYYIVFSETGMSFISNPFEGFNINTAISYTSSFLFYIALFLLAYNVKNVFPKQLNIGIIVLIIANIGLRMYYLISSISSWTNSDFVFDFDNFFLQLCPYFYTAIIVIVYLKYNGLYFIHLHRKGILTQSFSEKSTVFNNTDCYDNTISQLNTNNATETDLPNDKQTTDSATFSSEQIRFCRKCGVEIQDDAMFCFKCGTKII